MSRLVEVGLRHEGQRPAEPCGKGRGALRELGEEVNGGVVDERMHGVEPQRVDVEVLEPAQSVVDDEVAHPAGTGLVEIDGPAPRRLVRVGEVRPELREVVAVGAQVVVDDVEAHADALGVRGVDESLQRGRAAVGLVHGVQRDAVVAPTALPGEGGTGISSIISMPRDARGPSAGAADGVEGALRG